MCPARSQGVALEVAIVMTMAVVVELHVHAAMVNIDFDFRFARGLPDFVADEMRDVIRILCDELVGRELRELVDFRNRESRAGRLLVTERRTSRHQRRRERSRSLNRNFHLNILSKR